MQVALETLGVQKVSDFPAKACKYGKNVVPLRGFWGIEN